MDEKNDSSCLHAEEGGMVVFWCSGALGSVGRSSPIVKQAVLSRHTYDHVNVINLSGDIAANDLFTALSAAVG